MTKPSSRPTVAVIGCGPSGISFLHAVAMRKKKLEELGDDEAIANLPHVTVFERSSNPGGVWRAKESVAETGLGRVNSAEELALATSGAQGSTNMYEALWTNGPKELIEYFDYTYQDHFNHALPVYMPRELLLDYFITRVTRNNPGFFQSVKFNTNVVHVKYDDETAKFEVITENKFTKERQHDYYDKCIWAAGVNGVAKIPTKISALLKKGNFHGKSFHSSGIDGRVDDIKDKNILIIGDSYSAEDLTLTTIKQGAKKVYINSRSKIGVCHETEAWPMDKVEILSEAMPTEVIQDGKGLRFRPAGYKQTMTGDTKFSPYLYREYMDVESIDVVIYCTGYDFNVHMLDESLNKYNYTSTFETSEVLPPDWKMSSNEFSQILGSVIPDEEIISSEVDVCPGVYRGLLESNPNMMFLAENGDTPLFNIDINAWLLLAFIMGDVEIPTKDGMDIANKEFLRECMDDPNSRYMIDMNYQMASDKKISETDSETSESSDSSLSSESSESSDSLKPQDFVNEKEEGKKVTVHFASRTRTHANNAILEYSLRVKRAGKDAYDACYPLKLWDGVKLTGTARKIIDIMVKDEVSRSRVGPKGKGCRKTFRDQDVSGYRSIHTGICAVPLPKLWLDIDESDPKLIASIQ